MKSMEVRRMAEGKKDIYPVFPAKWWWDLRRQFRRSLPSSITDTYLASVLNISTSSAKNVLIPVMKLLGIINQDGTLNDDRARAWRDDEQYPQVCQAMVGELYPQELLDAFPEPSEDDRRSIVQWFARKTGVGETTAQRMATFYLMLSEADPTKETKPQKAVTKREKAKVEPTVKPKLKTIEAAKIPPEKEGELSIPSININIQVHISSDASASQIDEIFSSMAKHLNIRRKISNE